MTQSSTIDDIRSLLGKEYSATFSVFPGYYRVLSIGKSGVYIDAPISEEISLLPIDELKLRVIDPMVNALDKVKIQECGLE